MKKPTSLSLLAVLLFAAIAAGLWLTRPADQTPRVAELEHELQQANAQIAKLKATLAKPRSIPAFGPGQTPSSKTVAAAGGASGETSEAKGASGGKSALAKMFKDPQMKDMMKAQAGMQIEMQYSKLIGKFGLDEAETSHFKKLLGDRVASKTDMGFKMMDSSLTKEQRQAVTAEYDTQKKASDAAIKGFLNNDTDFTTFQHWEDTEPERMQMMLGRGSFDAVNAPLSTEQEEQLINVMAEVRKRPGGIPDLNEPKNIDPSMMTDAFNQRLMANFDQQQRSVLENATGFLTPPQLQALKKMQEQMRALTETSMKMSKEMMGN